jgi:hypothetical protein
VGLVVLLTAGAFSQDKTVASEFDPGINFQIDPGGRFTYDVYTERNKSEDLEAGTLNIGGGVRFRLKSIFKTFLDELDTDKNHLLVMRLAYEYSRAAEGEETKITNTIMADITPRYQFPGRVLMSDRSRFELRWIDGDPSFRYRNRLRFERPISLFKRKLVPYVGGEAFWDSRYSSWNKFRYGGGAEVQLFKIPFLGKSALELSFDRERCVTCPDPHTNIVGAKLNFYIKRKK